MTEPNMIQCTFSLPGGKGKYLDTLVEFLTWLEPRQTTSRMDAHAWFQERYNAVNCGGSPELHVIQDPARLGWVAVVQAEHYHIDPGKILAAETSGADPLASAKSSWSLRSRAIQNSKRIDFDGKAKD